MKKSGFVTLIAILITVASVNAQGRYEKAAGFNGNITSMITTLDGGFAFAGTSDSDSGNVVVARYNSSGSRLWMKEIGTITAEYAHDITQTSDGGFVVTGKRGYWQFKMLAIKFDSTGNLLWSREFNSSIFDRANGVCATTDGGVVIAGRIDDGISYQAVAFKLTATGVQLWSRSVSGFDDGGYSIIRSSDGKFVMTGMTNQGASLNIGVVKFDSSTVYWSASIGGSSQEFTGMNHQLVQTQDGGYVISGNTSTQGGDYYISKLSSSGTFLWSKSFGTSANEFATGITASGNDVFVTGYTQSGNFPSIFYSPCLFRMDGSGVLNWSYQYGTSSSNVPASITPLPSGQLIVGGRFSNGTYAGKAALSNFDFSGNACKQQATFGSTISLTNIFSMAVSSGPATIFMSNSLLNITNGGAETISCSCGTGVPLTITSTQSTICYGSNLAISYPYQAGFWYTLYRNGSFVSTTNSSYFVINQGGNYYVIQNGGCGLDTSNTIHINVNSLPPATITASGKTKVCVGQSVSLSATSTPGMSYQWLKNGGTISGATLPTYSASQSGLYSVRVTSGLTGCTKTGNSINVIVNPVPAATTTATGPTTFCAGDSVELQANTGSGLTYQWKLNGNNISGATANSFAAKLDGNYRVRVSDSNNCSKLSNLTVVNIPCRTSSPNEPLQVYPNPSKGIFQLMLLEAETILRIYALDGRIVYEDKKYQTLTPIDLTNQGSGVYLLTTENSSGIQHLKIILTE
jgi:Secretion system C-terminal sorting domain/Ig-like domain CHU_C associated